MRSALRTVERRWAMMKVVRASVSRVIARWMASSDSASSAEVASSRSEEHTSELQSRLHLVCRLLLGQKNHTADHQSERHYVSRRQHDQGLKAIIRKGEDNDD